MSPRSLALAAAAALVALGGVYLLIEVRSSGAAAPSDKAIAEAAARGGRTTTARNDGPSIPRPDAPPSSDRPPRERGDRGFPGNKSMGRMTSPNLATMPGTDIEPANMPPPEGADDAEYEQAMLETNKLYDRHDYDGARTQALKLLEKKPGTVRMLRVVVSSSCILGDGETAQRYWTELPEGDRVQMTERCSRYDVTFTEKNK